MKVTLEFGLPQEKDEFEDASKGLEYYCVLTTFLEDLLRAQKDAYLGEEPSIFYAAYGKALALLQDALDTYGVNLDK